MLGFVLQPGADSSTQIDANILDWWQSDPNAAAPGGPSESTNLGDYIGWITGGRAPQFPIGGGASPVVAGGSGARQGWDSKTVFTAVGAVFVAFVLLRSGR